jgi:phage FluMu gp28-like protein
MQIVGFTPRPTQREILSAKERFLFVDAGRRYGKTILGLNWLLEGACNDGGENFWTAPIFAQSKMAFRSLMSAAHKGDALPAFKDISQSELRVELVNGGVIHFKSADNPDSLRGAGVKRAVMDECARQQRDTFEEVLRPALSDTHGRLLGLSTPKGKNFFYELWTRGFDPAHPDYRSWKFPTSDNPKVPAEDIEQARLSLPVDVFSQEYLAEFLDNNAGVFRNVKACMGSVRQAPNPRQSYRAGLDLARLTDFTVLTILDESGRQVFFDRFNILDWTVQVQRIVKVCQDYQAPLLIDSTGIGDPIFDQLQRAGLSVEGYKFTQDSKKKLVELLMLSFEQARIRILDEPVQKNEIDIFEYTIGQSGTVHYSAPDGYHDDCVIALALANWALFGNMRECGFEAH